MTLGAFISPFDDAPGSADDLSMFRVLQGIEAGTIRGDSLPLILWIARSATLNLGGMVLPPRVTLSFAPGAVLRLQSGASLDLQGRLDAGVERRFELAEGSQVYLRGPLDEIHASWWGAGADSVTHALNALWDRYHQGVDAAPIQLAGPYLLRDTVRVEPPTAVAASVVAAGRDPFFDVVLRGRHYGARSPMTFTVDDVESVGGVTALLAVDGRVTLTLENVGFDATRPSGRRGAGAALILAGEHDRSHIAGCSFRVGDGNGIEVTAFGLGLRGVYADASRGLAAATGFFALLAGSALLAASNRRAARVSVSRCDFEGVPFDKVDTAIPIAVDATAPTMLEVSDCQFRGSYDCGILFMGSDLMVTHCAFDNVASPVFSDPSRRSDIHVGPRELSTITDAAPNAHLTATHCVSTSPCFLVGRQGPTSTGSGGALLTNILHQPNVIILNGANSSVRWIGPYESRSLVLQGCELGAPVRLEGTPRAGVVVNLGTRFTNPMGGEVVGGTAESVVGLYDPMSPTRP